MNIIQSILVVGVISMYAVWYCIFRKLIFFSITRRSILQLCALLQRCDYADFFYFLKKKSVLKKFAFEMKSFVLWVRAFYAKKAFQFSIILYDELYMKMVCNIILKLVLNGINVYKLFNIISRLNIRKTAYMNLQIFGKKKQK